MKVMKLGVIFLFTTLLITACSDAPSESTVETLIEAQFEKANEMGNSIIGDDTTGANSMLKGMMASIMPQLEDVENVNCESTDEKNTYRCTADVTMSINGTSHTNKSVFKVYKVNDEWVLSN